VSGEDKLLATALLHDPMVVNNVIGLAKTAKVFNVPTILTTVIEERGGYLIKGLQDVFPEQKPINRTFINTWQDERAIESRLMAVQIGKWLVVDQYQDAVFGAKQRAETGLGHGNSIGCYVADSGASWVEKDVEGLDAAALEQGDVGARHGHATARWTGLPAQPSNTVVADGCANRRENEVWRQARQ
jgi:hypothetical protein